MSRVVVRTKEELKRAYAEKVDEIIVEGKMAKQIRDLERIKQFSPVAIGALAAAGVAFAAGSVAGPLKGGMSFIIESAVLTTTVTTTGLSIPLIIFACAVGVSLLFAIFKEYDVIEASGMGIKIILRKKN